MLLLSDDALVQAAGEAWCARFVPDSTRTGQVVIEAFRRAAAGPTSSALRALDDAIAALGREMRATGLAPARALLAFKALLCDAVPGWRPFLVEIPGELACVESRLYAAVFETWLSAYYGERGDA